MCIGLCSVSDGRPSDSSMTIEISDVGLKIITESVASLAKQFGKRLQVDAVGIGDVTFETLQAMVERAEDYGPKASMNLASKSAGALISVLESFQRP